MNIAFFKNLSRLCAPFCALLTFACSADGSSKANGEYVRASAMAEDSAKEFKSANYKKSLELANAANEKVRNILEAYPDSQIALQIVTDANLRIGFCKYSDFRERILPNIEKIANPKMAPFDLVWASVVGGGENSAKSALELGIYLAYYKNQIEALEKIGAKSAKKIPDSDIDAMLLVCMDFIKDQNLKLSLSQAIQSSKLARGVEPREEKAESAKSEAEPKFVDAKKFLESANKDAVMSVYNVESSARLLKASGEISPKDPAFAEFQKLLLVAFENVKKISSRKLKNLALCNIVGALSNSHLADEALAAATLIEGDDALRGRCLATVSACYADGGNFAKAVEVANMLPDGRGRYAGLNKAAISLATSGDIKGAVELAKTISDKASSTACLLDIAAICWRGDPKKGAEILDSMDIAHLSSLDFANFCAKVGIKPSVKKDAAASHVENAISVVEKIQQVDGNLAKAWLVRLAPKVLEKSDPASLEANVSRVCLLMLNTALDTKQVQDFAYEAMLKANPQIMGKLFADLGVYASLKGLKADAEGFFRKSAAICKSPKGQAGKTYLLWQMCVADFDRAKAVEIVGEFLPKLSGN